MNDVNDAIRVDAPQQADRLNLEQVGALALFGMAGAVQFSIAAAQILLAVALICWIVLLIVRHERFEAPSFFWPMAAYAGATLISAAVSPDPRTSLIDCKQLVLFLIVPAVYRFVAGTRPHTLLTVVITCAAISAVFGIVQYGILHYDNLGQRPQGTLGHWMTYSGLLMVVIGVAIARVIFGTADRTWAALVLPALGVAVALTFTRGAAVGACAAVALLFSLKDFRLFAILPILAAIFIAVAPGQIAKRYASMFNMNDPTVRDRYTMLRIGERMIRTHPLTGVGPNMVQRLYVAYRGPDSLVGPDGVTHINPHLHNDFLQIAAERGLPALAIWLWFLAALLRDLWQRFQAGQRELAATAMATVVALLTAGLFEYNFGDSEVLMLFLTIVTLPAAAARLPRG
ncbi:MAG: putative bicarbonate transporter, IctB family [Acidobacteria bacterium]|nr:putative bicarbonate transporter, IctB family [Acidobacteriota bacterium]